jgi:acyl-coenzyme A thioesterase PaaI-like protein
MGEGAGALLAMDAEGRVLNLWQRWSKTAWGRRLYSFALGRMVPYSGSIRPLVLHLEPGFARIELRDRRMLRNHLHSIHAIALANLGELASGLAIIAALPDDVKAIVTRLDIEYLKKARGRLLAEGRATVPGVVTDVEQHVVTAEITDAAGDCVACLKVYWQIRPGDQA